MGATGWALIPLKTSSVRAMQVEELGKSYSARLSQPCEPLLERRDSPRYSVDEDSVLLFMGQGNAMPGSVVDLSQDGCCIRTKQRCTMRIQWPLEVAFKINGTSFQFSGILQWTNGRDLLGIHFVNMAPRRMVELAKIICEMESAAASKTEAANMVMKEAPAPVEPRLDPMAEGKNIAAASSEVIVLPVSPRPAVSSGVALVSAAPSAHAEAVPQIAKTSAGRDRRKTTRHEVDTSATIFLVNVGSTLRGRILDLSLSGCRIRTDERFPVGIYTRVETEFRLEGLPFRLGGVIQSIHDRNHVGIRFLDLSERKREQVSDLIAEIDELHAAHSAAQTAPAADGSQTEQRVTSPQP